MKMKGDEGTKVEQALVKARNALTNMRGIEKLATVTEKGKAVWHQNGSELDKQLSKAKRSLSRYRAQAQKKGLE